MQDIAVAVGRFTQRRRMALKRISSNKCFGGLQEVFEHETLELKCKMKFAVYLPPKAETGKCPALYWLSGLTSTEQTFTSKSGYHQAAPEHSLVNTAADTGPRGCHIKGEDGSWHFGTRAGFYVNASEDPWRTDYRMYSYVTEELPQLIHANFPVDPQRMSIFGHSMEGHDRDHSGTHPLPCLFPHDILATLGINHQYMRLSTALSSLSAALQGGLSCWVGGNPAHLLGVGLASNRSPAQDCAGAAALFRPHGALQSSQGIAELAAVLGREQRR
ncbi:S-formylglutathione hydrolase-like [Heterocephalus glaber]|uniref:S-formylglutathione hydrolase n=1 Tax=Heterocephalus glaber TaxID=10181 RepID=A0AAX6RU84_HETGA|nr:S-formylglutathione hydrolase-like [Heterocephalus glaber]